MKKTRLLNLVLLTLLTFGCKSTLESSLDGKKKTAINSVDNKQKKNAYNFAYGIFNGCKTNKFPKLTISNSTDRLINLLTQDLLKSTCTKINESSGELKEMNLIEILVDKNSNMIYRYKADYEKKKDTAEIRVYTNSRNQFSGIIIRPKWFDKYYEKDKYPTEK